jgi:hypothetical protein
MSHLKPKKVRPAGVVRKIYVNKNRLKLNACGKLEDGFRPWPYITVEVKATGVKTHHWRVVILQSAVMVALEDIPPDHKGPVCWLETASGLEVQ